MGQEMGQGAPRIRADLGRTRSGNCGSRPHST